MKTYAAIAAFVVLVFVARKALAMNKIFTHHPLKQTKVNSNFGWRMHPVLKEQKHHNGVDLDGEPGDPIYSAGAGTVAKAGFGKGYGNHVIIEHREGYTSKYGHMRDAPLVEAGQVIRGGKQLGVVGSTGMSTGPHLHFEIRKDGEPVDPASFYPEYRK